MSEIPSKMNILKTKTIFFSQKAVSCGLTVVPESQNLLKTSNEGYFGPFCLKEFVVSRKRNNSTVRKTYEHDFE